MNLKTSKIDNVLFWIGWCYGLAFVFQILNLVTNWFKVGTMALAYAALYYSIRKLMNLSKKQKSYNKIELNL